MATAAPAAAPSAPSAPPSAPGGPADATVPVSGAPAPEAGPDKTTRLAKPLKPIPSLPGVFADEDPFPPPPSRTVTPSDTPGVPGPARGPDGRFVAPSSAANGTGEPALEAAAATPPTPTPGRFKFAGEEFASQEAAEQNFKSLRGQFKPIQTLARQLGGVDKIATTLASAAESARLWKAEAERLAAGATSAVPPTTAAPDAQPAPEADLDWELYAEIKKLATDSGEPWKAEQWLVTEMRKIERARYDAMLDARLAPLAEQDAQAEVVTRTEDLWSGLAQYSNADGTPAFPELNDPEAAHEVGLMWHSMGLPAEAALTPQGAIAAIAIYRMAKQGRSQAAARTIPPAPAVPAAPAPPTDAHAAAELGDGRTRSLRVADASTPSAEAAAILAGLRQVNSGSRAAVLGFEP